jgi:hypothetical protein
MMKNITPIPLTLLVLACFQANAAATTTNPPTAVTAAGTGYSAFVGDSYIDLGEAMEPMAMADMLLCIVSASGAPLLPNDTYQAIADFDLCGAGGGSNQATYSSMTVESSRASADVAQVAKMWILMKEDALSPVKDIHFKAQLSSAPTATNHIGEWQLDWEFQNPGGANTWENGNMEAVTGAGGFAEFTMATNSDQPGGSPANNVYAKIAMTSLKEGVGRVTTSNPAKDFAVAFNDTLVTIKEGSNAATCQSIENFSDIVYEYNLYDSSGALVDINAQIEFTTATGNAGVLGQYSYWDNESETEQTGYWAWIEDNGYPATDGATTVSDSTTPATKYTITWDIEGSGSTAYQTVTAVADGLVAVADGGSAHVFDKPIIFNTSSAELATTITPLTDRNDDTDTITTADLDSNQLTYNGPGRLWGIKWNDSSRMYEAALADGTALISKATGNDTVHTSKTYYVKAARVAKTPDVAADCSVLSGSLASASALGLPTVADITNNPVTLGTEPTVTAEPKIKDGVLTN